MSIQADSSTMTTPRPPDPIAQRTIPSTMVPLCGFSSKVGPFAAMLNRRWGTLRMTQLRPWVRSWAGTDLYAGVPRKGAMDAWYGNALHLEQGRL